MDDCNTPLTLHAKQGLRHFNAGEYFQAHEELETTWREEAGPRAVLGNLASRGSPIAGWRIHR
jgi:hypothetical protein